jgi:hypothetical protein
VGGNGAELTAVPRVEPAVSVSDQVMAILTGEDLGVGPHHGAEKART